MKKKVIFGVASLAVGLSYMVSAHAEPLDDAQYIVDATLSDEYLSSVMDAVANLMASGVSGEMAKNGVRLSEEASQTIVALMMPTFIEGMKVGLRDELVDVYLDYVSPKSLAAYRAFLETPAGLELLRALPEITTVSSQVGEQLGYDLGINAAGDMMKRIKSGDFPPGTSEAVRDELTAVFDR